MPTLYLYLREYCILSYSSPKLVEDHEVGERYVYFRKTEYNVVLLLGTSAKIIFVNIYFYMWNISFIIICVLRVLLKLY